MKLFGIHISLQTPCPQLIYWIITKNRYWYRLSKLLMSCDLSVNVLIRLSPSRNPPLILNLNVHYNCMLKNLNTFALPCKILFYYKLQGILLAFFCVFFYLRMSLLTIRKHLIYTQAHLFPLRLQLIVLKYSTYVLKKRWYDKTSYLETFFAFLQFVHFYSSKGDTLWQWSPPQINTELHPLTLLTCFDGDPKSFSKQHCNPDILKGFLVCRRTKRTTWVCSTVFPCLEMDKRIHSLMKKLFNNQAIVLVYHMQEKLIVASWMLSGIE